MAELAAETGIVPFALDPLSADKVCRVVAVLRRDRAVGRRWRFASIELREPPKGLLRHGAALFLLCVCSHPFPASRLQRARFTRPSEFQGGLGR
jgi:hypothetical protein